MQSASRTALRVALLYAGLAFAWGLFSHSDPANALTDIVRSPKYEEWVDFGFAVLTGLLLFAILRAQLLARVEAGNRRTQDELRHAYSEMELRVHARTADLQRANRLLRQEIAERDRMERDLSALLDFSHQLATTLRIQPLLELVLDRLEDLVGYTGAAVYECQGESLAMVARRGPLVVDPSLDDGYRNWEGAFTAGEAAGQTAPVIGVDQVTGGSAMLLPLMLQDRVVGALRLSHSHPGYYSERQARLAFIIANQAAVAIENARLYEEAQRTGVLRERARLARELHDSIVQEVHGIVWKIQAARAMAERGTGSIPAILESAAAHAKASLSNLRALVFELRPELLEQVGLTGLLAQSAETLRAGCRAEICVELGDEPALPLHIKEALYRIGREALSNAVKHADARQIVLRLEQDSHEVLLEVADDGVGFDSTAAYPGHLGLTSMRERTLQVHGSAEIVSEPLRGTRVVVRVPCVSCNGRSLI